MLWLVDANFLNLGNSLNIGKSMFNRCVFHYKTKVDSFIWLLTSAGYWSTFLNNWWVLCFIGIQILVCNQVFFHTIAFSSLFLGSWPIIWLFSCLLRAAIVCGTFVFVVLTNWQKKWNCLSISFVLLLGKVIWIYFVFCLCSMKNFLKISNSYCNCIFSAVVFLAWCLQVF